MPSVVTDPNRKTGIIRDRPLHTDAVGCDHCPRVASCLVWPIGCTPRAVCPACRVSRYQLASRGTS